MIMHPGVKLRHIRAFVAIADEGNLSEVARAQGITQPALSRTLAELEDLLGAALFRREKRRLILNEQGAVFRRHASLGLQSFEAGVAALRPGFAGGAIRVGILPTAATRLLPRVALRLREIAPEILLKIETGPHTYLVRLLRDGGINLMIGRMPDAAEMAGLAFEHLYEEDIVLVTRAGHPLAAMEPREILRKVPVILPPDSAIIRRAVNEYLITLNLPGLIPAFETAAFAIGRGILAVSDAAWFISRGVVAEELESGTLTEIPTGVSFLAGAVGMTYRQAGTIATGLDLLMRLSREGAKTQS